jgi:hypothetical protein
MTSIIVGWVERSDTHQVALAETMMGIAALHPSYVLRIITIRTSETVQQAPVLNPSHA